MPFHRWKIVHEDRSHVPFMPRDPVWGCDRCGAKVSSATTPYSAWDAASGRTVTVAHGFSDGRRTPSGDCDESMATEVLES